MVALDVPAALLPVVSCLLMKKMTMAIPVSPSPSLLTTFVPKSNVKRLDELRTYNRQGFIRWR